MTAAAKKHEDRLVCGDNLNILAELRDTSVDLIYVDPPFATGGTRRGRKGLSYDDLAPGGVPRFVDWLKPRLEHMQRVLSRDGSLFVHLDWRATHYVKVALDQIFAEGKFVNEIVWGYSIGGKASRAFGRKHDTILWYAKTDDYIFNADAVRIPRKKGSHMRVELDEQGRPVQTKRDKKTGKVYRYPVHEGKVPEDTWTDIETLNHSDKERTDWPTQKPEALLKRIILAASHPGALVADFFCGSGTTCVVAAKHGRHYLGVDAESAAIAIAERRVQGARREPTVREP